MERSEQEGKGLVPVDLGLLVSAPLVFFPASVYLWGLVLITRQSVLLEALVALILPLFFYWRGSLKFFGPRLTQLFFIESLFNLIAVISKGSIQAELPRVNALCSLGFVLFFVFQVGGFILTTWKRRKIHGLIQAILMALAIAVFWFDLPDRTTILAPDGRLLMWGQEASTPLRLLYCAWILNVLFVDSPYMPKLTFGITQLASVAVALWSQEFFHVRLLTACHLFFLEGLLGFAQNNALGPSFCAVPKPLQPLFFEKLQPALAWATTLSCSVIVILYFLWK